MMGTPLGPDFAAGDPRRDRVGYLFNNLVDIEVERAWFYQDAALARRAVEWSDSARSRWESFHDNWPAIGSVLFQRGRAWHALGALTRDLAPLDSADASLRASADYRGPGRPRIFAETREERASLALDRSALEPDTARSERLLRAAVHDLDTARVALATVGAIPEQLAALRSEQAEVFIALARVTRSAAWLDSARTRLSETAASFPHTGFPREASLQWMRQGQWETARADLYADPTSVVAARGAFERARSLARSRRDRTILARVDAAERSLDKLPLESTGR
jgi:tetratricopeptide (TPR) repeat protein